jgi:hypothetical protein
MGDIADSAKSRMQNIAGDNAATNDDPIVWVGKSSGYVPMTPGAQPAKSYQKLSDIQQKVRAWSASRSQDGEILRQKMVKAGFISKSSSTNPDMLGQAMAYPVRVYQAYSAEGGSLSFDDWLDWYSSTSTEDGSGGAYTGPVTTTSVTVTDETTAEALLDKFSRDLLGRGLTKQETNKYLRQFRAAEMEAPQVTTTEGSRGTRTSMTETAASKEELLRQVISSNPDFEKYQIDTTVMDMLLNDIKAGQEVIRG